MDQEVENIFDAFIVYPEAEFNSGYGDSSENVKGARESFFRI